MSYYQDAIQDAADLAEYLQDQILTQLKEDGKASDDFRNDYEDGDSYFHESYIDKSYDLSEAAEILDELSEYEETDSGLWEGLAPRDAILAQAAYTYSIAVEMKWRELIEKINDTYSNEIEALKQELKDEEITDEEAKEVLTGIINSFKE